MFVFTTLSEEGRYPLAKSKLIDVPDSGKVAQANWYWTGEGLQGNFKGNI
jgi:hypothetical protein